MAKKLTQFTLTILLLLLALPRPALAADPRCVDTRISAPAPRSTQSGIMLINGRAQLEGAFVRYQVDFSTTGLNLWVLINSAPQAVVDGTLARWDTTPVPDGSYDLRVRTIDTSGNYCETIVSPVFVSHSAGSTSGSPASSSTSAVSSAPPRLAEGVIEIPTMNGTVSVELPSTPAVPYCTPAYALGGTVTRSVRLCAGQTYRPFTILGNGISVIGDANRTATIASSGRAFAIRVRGSNVVVNGVRITGAAAPQDLGNWLCLYEQCAYASPPIAGGVSYGGGILLEGSNNTVMNSQLTGGVIGIATLDGRGNRFINNQISSQSGWGIFAVGASNSAFVGNTIQDVNRSCTAPGGQYFAGGCESAGMLLMGADTNIIANNSCARSGNCYYLNGEGGRLNNFNKLYGNYCSAPSFNCFEITDAQGIEFDNNVATLTPDNSSGCEIWLVRAQIISGKNNRVPLCNHRGSRLESTYDPPK